MSEEKNSLVEEITPAMIDQLIAPPEFKVWAQGWLLDPGHPGESNRLITVLSALVKSGEVASYGEGLNYLARLSQEFVLRGGGVAGRDFTERRALYAFTPIRRYVAGGEGVVFDRATVIRQIGRLSHLAIGRYLSGMIPDYYATNKALTQGTFQPNFLAFADRETEARIAPRQLFSRSELALDLDLLKEVQIGNRISNGLYQKIEKLHRQAVELEPLIVKGGWKQVDRELFVHLRPIFGTLLDELVSWADLQGGEFAELVFLALCTWATFLFEIREQYGGAKVLFLEIPVLDFQLGLGQTRIDALEVVAVRGRDLDSGQLTVLKQFAQAVNTRKESVRSVAHLVKKLQRYLGTESFTIRIIDWKFSVGDAVQPGEIFSPASVYYELPAKHVTQIRQYLTLAALGNALLEGNRLDDIWLGSELFASKGQWAGYFPFAFPLKRRIRMDEYAKMDSFITLAGRFPDATRRSQIRKLGNFLLGQVLWAVEGKKSKNGYDTAAVTPAGNGRTLFNGEPHNHQTIRTIMERHYDYLDGAQVVRIVGKNKRGEMLYAIRLDRMLKGIELGLIKTADNFRFPDGKVGCLNPQHQDSRPSLHLYPHGGKCFACGLFGVYDADSVPADLQAMVVKAKLARQQIGAVSEIAVPDEVDQIMRVAQEILQNCWRKSESGEPSPGWTYLQRERKLDPELAYSLGVGYADFRLIHGLLDAGWSYDQLIKYGLVAIRAIKREKSSAWLFEKRGMSREKISQPIERPGEDKPTLGWPTFPLLNRVTFPLILADCYSNFYGRLAFEPEEGSRQSKHHKLRVVGVEHGAFNASAFEGECTEVVLTEACFDGLTLIQAGEVGSDRLSSVIGSDNLRIFDYLARSGKDLALALDFDKGGRDATARITKRLQESGFRGRIRDFTADFTSRHPEVEENGYDDYNTWWREYGSLR